MYNRSLILLNVCFICFSIIVLMVGISFDTAALIYYPQLLDPVWLLHRLTESLFYLHTQPPLFNFMLGVALKVFPPEYGYQAMSLVYVLLGLVLVNSLFLLMVRLKIGPRAAGLLAFLFMIFPQTIIYENWLYISYPITVCLVLSALFLNLYFDRREIKYLILFFCSLAGLCGLWGAYHLFWLVVISLFLYSRLDRRQVLLAAAVPIVLIFSLYMKNY